MKSNKVFCSQCDLYTCVDCYMGGDLHCCGVQKLVINSIRQYWIDTDAEERNKKNNCKDFIPRRSFWVRFFDKKVRRDE